MPPAFLMIIDTCVEADELEHLKTALEQILNVIPDYCLVGLVTYGTHVQVYELGMPDCSKAYVFRGSKTYSAQAV